MKQQTLRKLRLASQIFFLALFFFLLFQTEFRGSFKSLESQIRLTYPVSIFLQADPLVSVLNALSTRALYQGLLWSLIILIPTFFLGRFFCGWVCPLGTLNHFFSGIKAERKRGRRLLASNRYQKWQTLKYYILVMLLVSAFFGSLLIEALDPISLLVRSLAMGVLPGLNYALIAVTDTLYRTQIELLGWVSRVIHFLLKDWAVRLEQPHFRQGLFLGLIFLTVLLLNLRITRFWCRALCPLGALLGLISRWSVLGLEKYPSNCSDCNRCELFCQGGDDPIPEVKWRQAECHLCFNCVGECAENGLAFKFFPKTPTTAAGPSLQRRRVLTGIAAGALTVPVLRSPPALAAEKDPRLIRPPGSVDETDFLARCIRCGQCMKVCPNNALHPTLFEAGFEGIWTPVLVPRIGYCEPTCVLCSQVCPTGAIWEISQTQKLGQTPGDEKDEPIRIGTAFYDRGRCLPWAMATECIVCEEWCPTSPKAIYLQPVEVYNAEGRAKKIRQPYVDPERCIGCGACEYACPVQDRPAVYVTCIGESRSETNQLILSRTQ
jgi:polyferredoxin